MRIYIRDWQPVHTLGANDAQIVEVYSAEGIFVVTDRGIFRQDQASSAVKATRVGDLAVDKTVYPLVKVHQLPAEHGVRQRQLVVSSRIQGRLKVVTKYEKPSLTLVDAYVETDETDVDMVAEDLAIVRTM